MAEHTPGVVIWGDGGGSTFRATVDAINEGIVDFDVVGVITTDPEAGILDHAEHANLAYGMDIEPLVVEGRPGRRQTEATQETILSFLYRRGTGNLALMGAMVIMGDMLVDELNGEVAESALPRTADDARKLMIPSGDGFSYYLPSQFQAVVGTGAYGLTNTHPAPSTVTANTHGLGAQRRMVELSARESGVTYHAVGKGIDTGRIIAAERFSVVPPSPNASAEELEELAKNWFARAQRIEKATLPLNLEMQLNRRQRYLSSLD